MITENTKCQAGAILRHLKTHGRIDSHEARRYYGCEALRSRISDLRKAGVPITYKWQRFTSQFGHKGAYKIYLLNLKDE